MSHKIVKCNGCGENIYELNITPNHLEPYILSSDFIGINGNNAPIPCDNIICPLCGTDIYNEICEVYRRNT